MEAGITLTLVATLGWGLGDVFARRAMHGAQPAVVLSTMIALSVVALGMVGLLTEGLAAFGSEEIAFFLAIVVMAVFSWVTGNLVYFHGMQLAGVVVAAPILGAAPLAAVALAILIGGERPGPWIWLGSILIVGGVVLLVTSQEQEARS